MLEDIYSEDPDLIRNSRVISGLQYDDIQTQYYIVAIKETKRIPWFSL